MGKRGKPTPGPQPKEPFHQAFAALKDRLPPGYLAPDPDPAPSALWAPARAVVRLERKGRGGKEATLVEKLELPAAELSRWADALKRSLGCGGGVEDGALFVQGDQRDRVARWLLSRGVKKVVRG
jgi:translation initiation factor 1